MNAMFTVIKEQVKSFYLIRRLSMFEVKSQNNQNYLGLLWEVIHPMIQIAIFWFVFGVGIRQDRDIGDGGIHFLPWMLAGIVVWFFANPAILNGAKSVHLKIKMVAKMNFPISVIPTYVIVSKFYSHLMVVAVVFIFLQILGFAPTVYLLQLPYYMFAVIVLMIAISMVTSTLSTIVRDFQMLIQALMRMLLYTSPILWNPEASDRIPDWVLDVLKLNPLYYVVEGYRSSLLGTGWYFIDHPVYTLYFWLFILVFLFFGSVMHMKFRNRFVEYI